MHQRVTRPSAFFRMWSATLVGIGRHPHALACATCQRIRSAIEGLLGMTCFECQSGLVVGAVIGSAETCWSIFAEGPIAREEFLNVPVGYSSEGMPIPVALAPLPNGSRRRPNSHLQLVAPLSGRQRVSPARGWKGDGRSIEVEGSEACEPGFTLRLARTSFLTNAAEISSSDGKRTMAFALE